jgi:glyoxylate carboligase
MNETDVMQELDSIEDIVPNGDWKKENSSKKISVQEKRKMDDVSKVSRVVVDKNGNKVVRKRLFSVSVGTLVMIAVAAVAIIATTHAVMNDGASDGYGYTSGSDYGIYLDY